MAKKKAAKIKYPIWLIDLCERAFGIEYPDQIGHIEKGMSFIKSYLEKVNG